MWNFQQSIRTLFTKFTQHEKGVISAQSNIHQRHILELDSALSNIFYLDPLEYPD